MPLYIILIKMGVSCIKCDVCKNQEDNQEIVNIINEYIVLQRIEDQCNSENLLLSQSEVSAKKEIDVDYIIPLKTWMPSDTESSIPLSPESVYRTLSEKKSKMIDLSSLFTLGGQLSFDFSKTIEGVIHNSVKVIKLPNKSLYKGEFNQENIPHGRGIEIRPDGLKYIGYFFNGKIQGQGRMINHENVMFEGNFITQDGGETTFLGESSVLHGPGLQVWPKGMRYKGDFIMGIKQGKGKLTLNEAEYEGDFYNDEMHGYGTMNWKNGYEGEWKNGLMHGQGSFYYKNGKIYKGSYENGEKNGKGTMKWLKKKRKYNGDWKNGKQHGVEKLTYFDNSQGKMRARNSLWEEGERKKWLSPGRELSE